MSPTVNSQQYVHLSDDSLIESINETLCSLVFLSVRVRATILSRLDLGMLGEWGRGGVKWEGRGELNGGERGGGMRANGVSYSASRIARRRSTELVDERTR